MTEELDIVTLELTDAQRDTFLDQLRDNPSIGTVKAFRAAGVQGSRGQLRQLLQDDDELARDAREARGYGDQTIRAEIARRAIVGVDEPVFHKGDVVGYVRKYSDRLLGMMAKAHLPEYRDRLDAQVSVAGRVTHTHVEGYTLADILAAGRSVPGLSLGSPDELPAAGELLAESDEGVAAAGDLPLRPAS